MNTHAIASATERMRSLLVSPLLWLTLAYLLFELSFAARLLDAAGGTATIQEIHSLENFGRVLSGVALGLVGAGLLLRRRPLTGGGRVFIGATLILMIAGLLLDLNSNPLHPGLNVAGVIAGLCLLLLLRHEGDWGVLRSLLATSLFVLTSIATMFVAQTRLVNNMVARLDDTDRRNAVILADAAARLSDCRLRVDDIFLCDGEQSPSGKAFTAVFPMLALGLPDLESKGLTVIRRQAANRFTVECDAGTEGCIGTLNHFSNNVWLPIMKEVRDSWEQYKSGIKKHHNTVEGVATEQERAWSNYVSDLKKRNWTPETVPERWHDDVRKKLGQKGLILHDTWQLDDRESFYRAVELKVLREADSRLSKELKRFDMDATIDSFQKFFAQRHVQQKIRATLGFNGESRTFPPTIDAAQIETAVYRPLVMQAVNRYLEQIGAPVSTFGPGGTNEQLGSDAAQRLIVPPIALFFSLVGGAGHLLKLLILLTGILTTNWPFRATISIGVVSYLIYMPMTAPNTVTQSQAYANLDRYVAAHVGARLGQFAGGLTAGLLEWTIRAQQYAYPINEKIRTSIMGSVEFGYADRRRVS